MHLPPTGGPVERDRLLYYVTRASKTRLSGGVEVEPSSRFLDDYDDAMDRLFAQREPPKAFSHEELFPDGHLCKKRFSEALLQINPDSNPGYPLVYLFSKNREVDTDMLYALCDELLLLWLTDTDENFSRMTPMEAFLGGYSYPSMCFVKGEGTSREKVARLIYGVSLVMNAIGRVLYGDYLMDMNKTWDTAQHKVGLDFSSEEGCRKYMNNYQRLFKGTKVGSNDVQGWEYQMRLWMSQAWTEAYIRRAKAHGTHAHLLRVYLIFESKALVADSQGYLHELPFYIMRSGKPSTHTENSDTRAALADTINGYARAPVDDIPSVTNGDDAQERLVNPGGYEELGFVVTDRVETTPTRSLFSSQVFEEGPEGLRRYPDGLAKLVFSVTTKTGNVSAVADILMHCRQHPGFSTFCNFVKWAAIVQEGEETVELPMHDC